MLFRTGLIMVAFIVSCSKPVGRPNLTESSGAGIPYASGQKETGPGTSNGVQGPVILTDKPSEIQLVNTKFAGQEAKLQAAVKYRGTTTARVPLNSVAAITTLTLPDLPVGPSDTMLVEIYEGPKLRFLARRANTLVAKSTANVWKLEDCAISEVPWDGENNEATCNWAIQDSK